MAKPAPKRGLLSITITNNSGVLQSYALFTGEPTVTPEVSPIYNDIITTFKGVSGNGGQAFFTMPSAQLHAICGTIHRDAIEEGVQTEIVDKQSVTLGHVTDEGKLIPGSTCSVEVQKGSMVFSRTAAVTMLGNPGCFCIRTATDFAYTEAKQARYILGFGVSTTPQMVRDVGPFAMFCPTPNTVYQVKPSNLFYVAIGSYAPRAGTPEGLEASSCMIDFGQLQSNDVGLVHDEYGKLSVVVEKPKL